MAITFSMRHPRDLEFSAADVFVDRVPAHSATRTTVIEIPVHGLELIAMSIAATAATGTLSASITGTATTTGTETGAFTGLTELSAFEIDYKFGPDDDYLTIADRTNGKLNGTANYPVSAITEDDDKIMLALDVRGAYQVRIRATGTNEDGAYVTVYGRGY